MSIDEFWANGFDDYSEGYDECPYFSGTAACQAWWNGWFAARNYPD